MGAARSCIDLGLELTETVSLRARGLDFSTRSRSFLRSVVQLAVRLSRALADFLRGSATIADLIMGSSTSPLVLIGCGALMYGIPRPSRDFDRLMAIE
jgi:hypothetical protein